MEIIGIDVSEHNGTLDWDKIQAAGIRFAIVRVGYGVTHEDLQFKKNMAGAIAAGIPLGAYHFSYALDKAGAEKEAKFALKLLEPYRNSITLPVFFDFEYDTISYASRQGVTLGREAFNDHSAAFCQAVEAAGYRPGVYYNLDYLRRYVDKARLGGYVQWFAQYAAKAGTDDYDLWQFSSAYEIPGHSGKFDVSRLKNAGLLGSKTYTPGWHQDSRGWWYADSAATYVKNRWANIDGTWYCFDEEGYRMHDAWKLGGDGTYYLGSDGAMMTNRMVGLDGDGRLRPLEAYYHYLKELPEVYRAELDPLIAAGKLRGRSGAGEELVLDLPESAVRAIIIANR